MIVIYVQQCQWLSMILCERYVKIIHMCNNDYEILWKVPSRGKHWGLCCFLWEGSTDLGEKQMLVLFGNLFGNNSNWEGGEQTLCWRDWRATTKYNRDHFMSKKSPVLLKIWEIILRLKVFGKRKHSPKDRCIALAVKFWFLAVCQFLHIFLKFTFCFYQAW